jgi:hypothetical protein
VSPEIKSTLTPILPIRAVAVFDEQSHPLLRVHSRFHRLPGSLLARSSHPHPRLAVSRAVNDVEHDHLAAILVNFINDDVWVFDEFARAGV